ncbi:hypothetical protein FRAHR75_620011 [Frankia sp. Hr75.2]|nr:hypothetical protein FRAHR75_620011 [Frankia sp. Hr75.2]
MYVEFTDERTGTTVTTVGRATTVTATAERRQGGYVRVQPMLADGHARVAVTVQGGRPVWFTTADARNLAADLEAAVQVAESEAGVG